MSIFSDRVALVTGGGRGLGFAYANGLAGHGALVVVQDTGADSKGEGEDPDVAAAAVSQILAAGGQARAASGPLATRADCFNLVEEAYRIHGRIDILIHNAGWVDYQEIEALTPENLERMLRLSLDASLWLAQAAWPRMRAQNFGRIVLTTSDRALYAEYAQPGLAAYAAAKAGIIGIVNVLAREGAAHDIHVNAVSPVAKTRMWGSDAQSDDLRPEAVVPGVLHLVSPASTASGWVLRASNGQFAATQVSEAAGVNYPRDLAAVPADTLEDVADAWDSIACEQPEPRAHGGTDHDVVFNGEAVLGECPVWSAHRRALLWVDTPGRASHCATLPASSVRKIPSPNCSIAGSQESSLASEAPSTEMLISSMSPSIAVGAASNRVKP